MKRDNNERKRRFRSYTVNFSSQKARMTIITMVIAMVAFSIIICVLAVQLMTGVGDRGLASRILHSISSKSLHTVMSSEIPMYASIGPTQTLAETNASPKGISNMLLYLFTDIDAGNPLTVLGFQVPGMAVSDFKLLTPDVASSEPPVDHNDNQAPPNIDPKPREVVEPQVPTGEPLVYIYHSHNREAFLPNMPGVTKLDAAYDPKENIENAGKWLLQDLQGSGYPTMQTLVDYWTKGSFDDAYDLSRPTVQDVISKHKDLKLIFDIHRDSLPKDKTTININGQDYAQIYWIIGGTDPHADQNAEVAKHLHDYMQQMYPGLSKGVWIKPKSVAYDTRYNQDLNPNMVLIEVGGPGNSLEEVHRTSDALAKVTAEYLKDVEHLSPLIKQESPAKK
ncbi:MAG: stage II sporulation protein P [Tumebacillaceae bacterium]